MAHPGFGHLWQQTAMSDADFVLETIEEASDDEDEEASEGQEGSEEQEDLEEQKQEPAEQNKCKHTILQQFPGHTLILSSSPYFRAQVSAEQLALSFRICIIGVSVLCCF